MVIKMDDKNIGTPAKLRELLCGQRQLLAQFLLITHQQEAFIANNDNEALQESLEQRQQIINQLDPLLAELDPLLQAYVAASQKEPGINELLEETGRILREATEIDNKNQIALRNQMNMLVEQMRQAEGQHKGTEAYVKGAETFPAEHFDQRQ